MSDEQKRGLGRVVYSVEAEGGGPPTEEAGDPDPALVDEASRESFPGSDPPSYVRGSNAHTTDPDADSASASARNSSGRG